MELKSKLMWLGMTVLAMFVSCGKKEEAKGAASGIKAEITVQAEKEWVPYYEKAIERVKANNPEAVINIKEIASFDHLGILDSTDSQNEDVADVFAYPLDRTSNLLQKQALAAFDAKAIADKVGGFADYEKGLGGQLKDGDKYIGFPLNIETLITFVNKVNAENAKIDITKPIEITQLPVNQAMLPVFNTWFGVAVTNSADIELLGQKDGKFFSDLSVDYSQLPAEKQAVIKGLFEYWQKNYSAKTALFDKDAGFGYMDEEFKTGHSAVARIDGPWATSALTTLAGAENLEILPISNLTFAGKQLKHWKGGWALGINARNEEDANKLALSQELISELLNPAYAIEFFKATGKIMENVTKDVYEKSDLSAAEKKVVVSALESYEIATYRPLFQEWGQVWDTWQNAILSWNAKKPTNVEQAYKEIQASFKALLVNLEK